MLKLMQLDSIFITVINQFDDVYLKTTEIHNYLCSKKSSSVCSLLSYFSIASITKRLEIIDHFDTRPRLISQ